MSLAQTLSEYISACFTGLWIESHEHDEALHEVVQLCREQGWQLASWNIDQGLQIPGAEQPADAGGTDPLAAIRAVNALANPEGSAILVLQNFHRFLGSPEIIQAMAQQIVAGKQIRACGRCLDAEAGGIYRRNGGATAVKPGRKPRRDPSNN